MTGDELVKLFLRNQWQEVFKVQTPTTENRYERLISMIDAELAKRDAEIARLREALDEYGQHVEQCPAWWDGTRCKCGWHEFEIKLEAKP